MPRPDRQPAARSGRRRSPGGVLIGVFAALAVAAACVLVLTDDQRLLRLGIIAALWAALVGAFAAARHRRDVTAGLDRNDELRQVYQLELEREVAARREHELQVETDARRRAEDGVRGELDGLRSEMCALRQNLEALLGGGVLVERVALRAESTRLRSLTDQSRARSADRALPHGTLDATPIRAVGSPSDTGAQRVVPTGAQRMGDTGAQRVVPTGAQRMADTGAQRVVPTGAPQPRQDARPPRPAVADVPVAATEVFPRYQGSGPRRSDSRPIDMRGRPGPSASDSRPIDMRGRPGPSASDSRPIHTDGRFAPPQPRMHDSGPIDMARRYVDPRPVEPPVPRPVDAATSRPADLRPAETTASSRPRHGDTRPQQPPAADSGRWSVVSPGAVEQPQQQWADFDSWVTSSAAPPPAAPSESGGRRRRADLQPVESASDTYVGRRRRADEAPAGRSLDELLASHRAGDAEPRRRHREGA